jgi:hypothetical protein
MLSNVTAASSIEPAGSLKPRLPALTTSMGALIHANRRAIRQEIKATLFPVGRKRAEGLHHFFGERICVGSKINGSEFQCSVHVRQRAARRHAG